jgi:hypothetical protein
MHATNDISHAPPQDPTCDALARELEQADFANGFASPSHEDDWSGEPPAQIDVLYSRYLYALTRRLDADPIPDIDLETAWGNVLIAGGEARRGDDYYVTRRRRCEAQALFWRALHIWSGVREKTKKENANVKRKATREAHATIGKNLASALQNELRESRHGNRL